MRYLLLFLFSVLLFTACETAKKQETPSDKLKRYELKGVVLSVDKANKKASIKHEAIPDYMPEMTMDFDIRPEEVFKELVPKAEVRGELVVDNPNGKYWLEVKSVMSPPANEDQKSLEVKETAATIDKKIIDFSLTNQDGKKISPKDFEGKVWALTFIYSECPLSEYCILMSKIFSDLANEIAEDDKLKDKLQLLSISFDPKRDTPEKLKKYGLGYLGKDSKAKDFKIWQLAVEKDEKVRKIADFFGLHYKVDEKDKTQFTHSLRTVVISGDGKITKVFTGNDWKKEDLLSEMKKAFNVGQK